MLLVKSHISKCRLQREAGNEAPNKGTLQQARSEHSTKQHKLWFSQQANVAVSSLCGQAYRRCKNRICLSGNTFKNFPGPRDRPCPAWRKEHWVHVQASTTAALSAPPKVALCRLNFTTCRQVAFRALALAREHRRRQKLQLTKAPTDFEWS